MGRSLPSDNLKEKEVIAEDEKCSEEGSIEGGRCQMDFGEFEASVRLEPRTDLDKWPS